MTNERVYNQNDKADIQALLIGRKVVKIGEDTLVLDSGLRLTFAGHEGGCSCSAGDYDLTELNGVDNIITAVDFDDSPAGDDYDESAQGHYKIFVFADNQRINLATFSGSDGNGYYGTGYAITVAPEVYANAAEPAATARQVLDLALPDNDSGTDTVRGYLTALLALVWEHEQGFNGKRPFGNSGWQDDLYAPLVRAGLVEGSFDEDGHLEAVDAAAEQLIQAAIDELGKATA